jgi:hypothetical protein
MKLESSFSYQHGQEFVVEFEHVCIESLPLQWPVQLVLTFRIVARPFEAREFTHGPGQVDTETACTLSARLQAPDEVDAEIFHRRQSLSAFAQKPCRLCGRRFSKHPAFWQRDCCSLTRSRALIRARPWRSVASANVAVRPSRATYHVADIRMIERASGATRCCRRRDLDHVEALLSLARDMRRGAGAVGLARFDGQVDYAASRWGAWLICCSNSTGVR